MITRRLPPLSLAAALVIAGCGGRSPPPAPPPLVSAPIVIQDTGPVVDSKAPRTDPTLVGKPPVDDKIEIIFAANSTRLPPEAARQLDVAARLFRDVGPARMTATGHSDARGDEFTNLLLSAQRARAVKDGLVARGIPANRLFIQALGQSEPLSRNEPNAPANRRVVVQWQVR